MCNDGSYCCDNDPSCCATNSGKFVNSSGIIIASPSAAAASSISGAATVTVTSAASGSGGMPAADKGAIGALAGVLALVIIGAGFVIWRKSRQIKYIKAETSQPQTHNIYQYPQEPFNDGTVKADNNPRPQEMGDNPRSKFSELESEPRL